MTNPTTDAHLVRDVLGISIASLFLAATACLVGCGSIDAAADESASARRLSSLDTPCGPDSEFTAESLLARLDAPYTASLPDSRGKPTTVQLAITYDGGARRCIAWADPEASARLELGVTLGVRTDNETIDASIPGTISVLAGSDQVRFSGAAPMDDEEVSVLTDDASGTAAKEKPTRMMVEGWLATDRRDFQGAVRLLRERGGDLWHHRTVASWRTAPPTTTSPPPTKAPR